MANKITRSMRRNPSGKQYAQRVNKAGDLPGVHASVFRHKTAALYSLLDGKLTLIRKECRAEWRDGFRLIQLGLVDCLARTSDTLYIKANRPSSPEYRQKLIEALKCGKTEVTHDYGTKRDKEFFFTFDAKDRYNDDPHKYVDMCAVKRKK